MDEPSFAAARRSRRCSAGAADAARAAGGGPATAGGSLGDALRNLQRYVQRDQFDNRAGRRRVRSRHSVRHQGRRVRPVDPPLHRAGEAQLVHSLRRDVDERARRGHVQRAQGRHASPICTVVGAVAGRRVQQRRVRRARARRIRRTPLPPEYPVGQGVLHRHVLLQRNPEPQCHPVAADRAADPPAASSSPASSFVSRSVSERPSRRRDPRADRQRQERARRSRSPSGSAARSSTATRPPSIAASTSAPTRCRSAERRGIPHHLIDIADPTEEYTAARYARDAARVDPRHPRARTGCRFSSAAPGFYYRALTRGLFPGPEPRRALARAARARSPRGAAASVLHRMLRRVDPRRPSGSSRAT